MKKILLTIGSIATAITPVAAVISCGKDDDKKAETKQTPQAHASVSNPQTVAEMKQYIIKINKGKNSKQVAEELAKEYIDAKEKGEQPIFEKPNFITAAKELGVYMSMNLGFKVALPKAQHHHEMMKVINAIYANGETSIRAWCDEQIKLLIADEDNNVDDVNKHQTILDQNEYVYLLTDLHKYDELRRIYDEEDKKIRIHHFVDTFQNPGSDKTAKEALMTQIGTAYYRAYQMGTETSYENVDFISYATETGMYTWFKPIYDETVQMMKTQIAAQEQKAAADAAALQASLDAYAKQFATTATVTAVAINTVAEESEFGATQAAWYGVTIPTPIPDGVTLTYTSPEATTSGDIILKVYVSATGANQQVVDITVHVTISGSTSGTETSG